MVNKHLIEIAIQLASRATKSVFNAYQRVVNSKSSQSFLTNFLGSGAQQSGFGKAAQSTIGRFISKPMTRDEACKILNLTHDEEKPEELNPAEIMDRFETLFSKNLPEKGGSFYLQSKIYFAKEHLMQDFPPNLNASKFNPGSEGAAEQKEEAKEEEKK